MLPRFFSWFEGLTFDQPAEDDSLNLSVQLRP